MEANVSRIGRMPIVVPDDVQVEIKKVHVKVKGPKGELVRDFRPEMQSLRRGTM